MEYSLPPLDPLPSYTKKNKYITTEVDRGDYILSDTNIITETKFRISNRKLLLSYKYNVNKDAIKELLLKEYRAKKVLISTSHQNEDILIYIDFGKVFQSKNVKIFDIEGLHPIIRKIINKKDDLDIINYLSKSKYSVLQNDDVNDNTFFSDKNVITETNFRISNRRLLLSYKSNLDKLNTIQLFFDKHKAKTVEFYYAYEYSHIIVDFGKVFQSTNVKIFDIKEIRPIIRKILK